MRCCCVGSRSTFDSSRYGQYRGVPFVVRSEFHISTEEYDRRKKYQWPTDLPGMMTGGTTFSKPKSSREPAFDEASCRAFL
jgi:hypothetical protein